ncbi:MAG: D-tyrosyl-tRNA(Tyr) deacylase, partial [Chloroflexi bacterium]|nr:D-tyrosyl-tRNA(Tyr) deacylase [Chloroflexota bacterium]
IAQIGRGLMVLVGVGRGDSETDARYLADKIANLRLFSNAEDRFHLSVLDIGAEILVVSQFTLYADTRKGRRPSFDAAAPTQLAEALVERFAELLQAQGLTVKMGQFGAHMVVGIYNDGPVTILLDSKSQRTN